MKFYVYILYSEKHDKFYIGQTHNVTTRLERHNNRLERFTASFVPWKLILAIEKDSRGEAMILEKKLKNLNREKLKKFIEKYS